MLHHLGCRSCCTSIKARHEDFLELFEAIVGLIELAHNVSQIMGYFFDFAPGD
jgi:hypothetical protein